MLTEALQTQEAVQVQYHASIFADATSHREHRESLISFLEDFPFTHCSVVSVVYPTIFCVSSFLVTLMVVLLCRSL